MEYWRRDKIANAKDGFYTFTLTPRAGLGWNEIQFTDYLQVMKPLEIANLVSPGEGSSVPAGNVAFDRGDVDRAEYYAIDLQYNDAGTWRQWDRIDASQSELMVNLADPGNWRWRVRARQNDFYGELDNESRTGWSYFWTF